MAGSGQHLCFAQGPSRVTECFDPGAQCLLVPYRQQTDKLTRPGERSASCVFPFEVSPLVQYPDVGGVEAQALRGEELWDIAPRDVLPLAWQPHKPNRSGLLPHSRT